MNLLNQLRFGGVFGWVIEHLRSTATESKGEVVRPGRFERPTFCSGGKRSIQLSYGRTLHQQFNMPRPFGLSITDRFPGSVHLCPYGTMLSTDHSMSRRGG